jgi:DNA repair protein RecO (recombination protein O)
MPLDQTEAIVLRSFPVGDQDKVVVFLSREKGLIRGVAKGARKFGNRFGASLEPMTLVKVFYYEKERKDLVTVSQCDILESFFEVYKDFRTSCTLAYFAELIEEFFPSRAREEVIFRLLFSTLQAVRAKGELDCLSRYFEAWFLRINGLLPEFDRCKKCRKRLTQGGYLSPRMDGVYCGGCAPLKKEPVAAEVGVFLGWARRAAPPEKGHPSLTPAQLESVGQTLQSLIIYHLEKEPKSLRYLKG